MTSTSQTRHLLTAFAGLVAVAAGVGLMLDPGMFPWHWVVLAAGMLASLSAWPRHGDSDRDYAPLGWPRRAADPKDGVVMAELRAELEEHKRLEEELLAAKQAAEAAMMSKGEFLATMSHEIRTPLNGIIPLLDILLSTPLGADQRDYVQTAYGSAQQLLRIVDDILDYSKLDANKLELESVGLNLKEVIESVIRLMEKAAEAKNLRLDMHIDPGVRLALRGDPVRLRQILTNLVSNAIKFTDRGSVSVSVTRRGMTRTHHELRLEVRDTGIGITPAAAARLFKPFSQADTSTTRTFGGTGLGLVICKRIVDLMGGEIGVDSEPGQGSVFWVNLSFLKALGDMGTPRSGGLQGIRVLVLTADPALMRRFSIALPNWGMTPVPASNTQEALNKLRTAAARGETWNIDLLLVDLSAVKATAIGLHRNVTREPALGDLRVIYLTGEDPPPAELGDSDRAIQVPRIAGDADLRGRLERLLRPSAESDALPAAPTAVAPAPVVTAPVVTAPAAAAPVPASQAMAAAATAAVPTAQGRAPTRATAVAGLGAHVLLVEDNPVNRQVAQRLLALSGMTLDCAENGREALDRLDGGHYAAVLMDCQMPVMDGYTATRERRLQEASQHLPRVPIIAMTANAMVGDREKCLESGMDDYMSKPLNRALLEETLRRWIPAAPVAATPPLAPSVPAMQPPVMPAVPTAAPVTDHAAVPPVAQAPSATIHRMPSIAPPPINREIVEDLRDIMGDEFASLVRVFLEDAPRSLIRLEAAAAAGDNDGLIGPAHSLKSTSANLGAMEVSAQAKHIEHAARQKTLVDAPQRVASLSAEFARAAAALNEML
jgi:signal transduction histidine kinase/DNA-binding response OmpR family regulator/HPt (histidine-containing phosphotransfer) domain-containing protein